MTAPQTTLTDETGRVIFRGTQQPPGGGSQPTQGEYACGTKSVQLDGTPLDFTLDTLANGVPVIDPATSLPAADGTYALTAQVVAGSDAPADLVLSVTLFGAVTPFTLFLAPGGAAPGFGAPAFALPLTANLTTGDQVFVEVAAKGTGPSVTIIVSVLAVKLA